MSLTIADMCIRLVLSIALSGLIGFEREHTKKPAGFRTHILVSIGSTTIMMSSILFFDDYYLYTSMDPTRLPAQVISGIGFLGAGTILQEGFTVKGLTTAASIWAVGCIGLVVGGGYYELSILSTMIVYITLKLFGKIQYKFEDTYETYMFHIEYTEEFLIETLFQYVDNDKIHLLSFCYTEKDAKFSLQMDKNIDYMKLLKKISDNERIYYINSTIEP